MIEGSLGRARWWFTDRTGGVSTGPYASLNLGDHVGDEPLAVGRNRALLAERLGLGDEHAWCWMRQVHGTTVVDADVPSATVPDADACVATQADRPLVVMTADCAPIVLVAGEGEALAVVHAGWAGLALGVIAAAVGALRVRSAAPISAVLGPCIRPTHYAFGAAELAALVERFGPTVAATTASGQPAFDLPTAVAQACREMEIAQFDDVGVDTYAEPELFSYRRDNVTGRQALVAVLA